MWGLVPAGAGCWAEGVGRSGRGWLGGSRGAGGQMT